ncbi:MAG: beta-lactamase family protein [Acidobacteria bacterium]|nr:beta-lactamase family protein [Acidobacteriota bacterium]
MVWMILLLLAAAIEPGSATMVLRDGKVESMRVEGFADIAAKRRVTAKTNFRLASVTKQFTATAILLLEREGKLQLDDPVSKHLQNWPDYARAITIRHLLQHESGLRPYDDAVPGATPQLSDKDVLTFVQQQASLFFEPGSGYRYSNTGYAILALIVERVSGLRFAEMLKRRIFQPLGMKGTTVGPAKNRAYGHSRTPTGWKRDDQSPTSAVQGDGGIYSSLHDLAKWTRALDTCRLLDCVTLQKTWTPSKFGYGLGWRIAGGVISHTGSTRGFRNVIQRHPAKKLTVVILTNRNEGEPETAATRLAN